MSVSLGKQANAGHYCRKGGAPVAFLDVPPFALPGRVVQSNDRMAWDAPAYGRVRMLFSCCGTVLVQFIDEGWEGATFMWAVALGDVAPVPVGVLVSVPCVGAAWSLHLPCGHINGEGCDCDMVAAEAEAV